MPEEMSAEQIVDWLDRHAWMEESKPVVDAIRARLAGYDVLAGRLAEAEQERDALKAALEAARPLLYAASNLPEPWGGWEMCDDVQSLIETARDYQKSSRAAQEKEKAND